jgi:hypothetical protein
MAVLTVHFDLIFAGEVPEALLYVFEISLLLFKQSHIDQQAMALERPNGVGNLCDGLQINEPYSVPR